MWTHINRNDAHLGVRERLFARRSRLIRRLASEASKGYSEFVMGTHINRSDSHPGVRERLFRRKIEADSSLNLQYNLDYLDG